MESPHKSSVSRTAALKKYSKLLDFPIQEVFPILLENSGAGTEGKRGRRVRSNRVKLSLGRTEER